MYGILLQSVAEIIRSKYGEETWNKIKSKIHVELDSISPFHQYGETLFVRIAKLLAESQNEPLNDVMNLFGTDFVSYISNYGYDRVLRILGHNMRDFLNGLDNLHEYMRYSYPRMRPPSFFVEKETANGLTLHYRSRRRGFVHYVVGQIREVGRRFYRTEVEIEIVSQREELDVTHVVFDLKFANEAYLEQLKLVKDSNELDLSIESPIFFELFPFHLVIDESMEILSAGHSLRTLFPNIVGELLRDTFHLIRPIISLTWSQIISHSNNVFEFSTIEPLHKNVDEFESNFNEANQKNDSDFFLSATSTHRENHDEYLRLRGQMLYIYEWKAIMFLATPVLENLDVMFNTGLFINDLSMHDSSRDLVLAGTQQSVELKLALDQEKQKSKALEESMKRLDAEMKKTDLLLYQMIPKKVADRLRSGEKPSDLCETFESCTILFSDVVGFTTMCASLTPMEVVSILNEMYTKFDKSLESHNCYKVETIGDAYMLVSGLPERARNHASEIIDMAFDMLDAIVTVSNPTTNEKLRIRIGCHSGPVVAGIAGIKMPRYCLFGDTVTIANKMEQTSQALHIHVSELTFQLLDEKLYEFEERSKMTLNGSFSMKTFFIFKKKDRFGNLISRPFEQFIKEFQIKEEKQGAQLKPANSIDVGTSNQEIHSVKQKLNSTESLQLTDLKENRRSSLNRSSFSKLKFSNGNSIRTSDTSSDFRTRPKSITGHIRSRTCTVL